MKPCKKCGENTWDYVKLDNDPHIYCTCKNCGTKLNFIIPKKRCSNCNEPTDFERVDVDGDTRGKKCKLCGFVKKMPIAKAKFKGYKQLEPDKGYAYDYDKLANLFFDAHPELERPNILIKE